MFRKHGKMIVSVVAVAAMTAALALTASAASNLPEIATSAAIPTSSTVIDGPALEGINWLHATGASAVSFASDLDDVKLVSADDTAVIDRNANTSTFVVKNGVDADVVFATDTTANDGTILLAKADGVDADVVIATDTITNDGTILLAKADGVNADLVFAGENNNPDAPIKIVFAEKMDNVIVRATDNIKLIQE